MDIKIGAIFSTFFLIFMEDLSISHDSFIINVVTSFLVIFIVSVISINEPGLLGSSSNH